MKSIKVTFILLIMAVVSAVVHNLIYAIFKIEEPVFFLLAFVVFIAAILVFIIGMLKKFVS